MSNPFEDLRQAVVVRPISSSIVVIRPISSSIVVIRPANSPGPQGPSGPELKIQYSIDAISWHDVPAENDMYVRFSTNNGRSWGEPLLISNLTGGVIGPESSVDGNIAVFDGTSGKVLKDVGYSIGSASYGFLPIGVPIPIWDHLSITIPPNTGSGAIYIRLTAGQNGSGGYNQGLLRSETVSGSAPLVTATAIVDLPDSPIYNQTIHLINTEEAFIRARTVSGELQNDQMQRITGYFQTRDVGVGGAFRVVSTEPVWSWGVEKIGHIDFNSANSPNARVSSTTSGETRSKNVSATWYLRIR